MNALIKSSMSGKIVSGVIIALVLAGTIFVSSIADVGQRGGILANLFIGFIGAIIAIQLVPGLILFGAMVKGLCSLFRKEKELQVETRESE
ncbi:hypothetical protein [Geotalea uraniireducens]|uniref:Uncharacterized protein n=1 Tax=Geotalea uraniireducens (strain Rf4) TaxID=351605 RepID=A5G515_GEOUR|nr:hypothetical protein [Geotalea uraniireducens]ABQ26883.1 hypothetical protein Gura_2709 [Geotalea uraniireducens Rf4]